VLSADSEESVRHLVHLELVLKGLPLHGETAEDRRGLSPLSFPGKPEPAERSRRITLLSFQRPRRLPRPRKKASGHTRGPSVPFVYGRIGLRV